jgi:TonB family protein
MTRLRIATAALLATLVITGCSKPDDGVVNLPPDAPSADRKDLPPVALNPDSPIEYPRQLFEEGIEGTVMLRMFVDSTGALLIDSTEIFESSGYPALDSAALAGAGQLDFSPPLRDGRPVAASFLQPVDFRAPGGINP